MTGERPSLRYPNGPLIPTLAIAILLGLTAGIIFLARQWRPGEPAIIRQARVAAGSGDEKALSLLDSWIERSPGDPEPRYLVAVVALRQGPLDRVAPALEKARELGHPAASLDRLWGLLLAKAGRDDQAFPLLKTAWDSAAGVRVDTEVAEALAKLTMARFDLQLATAVLDRWAREAPSDTKPLLWVAEIDRRLNSAPEVIAERYRQALGRDALCQPALIGLADLDRALGKYPEAAVHYASLPPALSQRSGGSHRGGTACAGTSRRPAGRGGLRPCARPRC